MERGQAPKTIYGQNCTLVTRRDSFDNTGQRRNPVLRTVLLYLYSLKNVTQLALRAIDAR